MFNFILTIVNYDDIVHWRHYYHYPSENHWLFATRSEDIMYGYISAAVCISMDQWVVTPNFRVILESTLVTLDQVFIVIEGFFLAQISNKIYF